MEEAAHRSAAGGAAESTCWEAVDGMVCINLDKRTDRWEQLLETMQGVAPEGKMQRLSAVVGAEVPGYGQGPWFSARTGERSRYWAGVAGCMLSHVKAIGLAMRNKWRNVLILEDDARASVTPDGLRMMAQALRQLSGKYLLYLGYNKPLPRGVCLATEGAASLWRIDGALGTHAYIVPESMYEPLLEALPKRAEDAWMWIARHRAIDTFYRDEVAAWPGVSVYSVQPLMLSQSGASSDLMQTAQHTTNGASGADSPRELRGLCGWVYRMCAPLRALKVRMNSRRTYSRARRGGFPGYRKKRTKK